VTKPPTIADLLGQAPLFYRSVALERDAADPSAGRSFVMTPWLERGAREMLAGLAPDSTRKAWRMIGDFGVGKSALALALIQALDPRLADPAMPMRRLAAEIKAPRMFPVLVTGSRDGLARELAASIQRAAATPGLLPLKAAKSVNSASDPFKALVSLRDAVRATGSFDGLLVVVDEMGKFLESRRDSDEFDVFGLQSLAEAAVRSSDAPLAVLLILHKGFQSYAEDWQSARRGEWQKVAERFEELVFDHPLSHTASLLSASLSVDLEAIPAKARSAYQETVARVRDLGWLGPRNTEGNAACWPLHPATIPVAARFFATFGQNERSLFGFMASEEPHSLRHFAASTPAGSALYALPQFFDYIASSLGHRLTSRASAGEWERITDVLERAADADAIETAILKTIGLLNLIDAPDLPATRASVPEALAPSFRREDVDSAIERLGTAGLVFGRSGRSELRLWTSRRVDLSAIWADAEREVSADMVLQSLPKHLSELPVRTHVLARRHSVLSGTNRRFAVQCTRAAALARYGGHGEADGGIVAVLCGDDEEVRIARSWAAEASAGHPAVMVLVVPPLTILGAPMVSLLRHRWIMTNASSLREDSFATAEIERSISDLETGLVATLESTLGLRGRSPAAEVELFWKGKEQLAHSALHTTVSALCDDIYDKAPLVANELVNRHALTSAGASARQRLIEHMFEHAHDPELGFRLNKNPPERSLYLSLLRRAGVHRQQDGEWVLAPPQGEDKLRLRPAIEAVRSRLARDSGRVALTEVYQLLADRPFGVRRGLSPLLLAILLVAEGHRVALFERGTYCTRIDGAAFMRILKSPEHFALQWVSLEGVRADVFHRLALLLDRKPQESGIRLVVDPLIKFGAGLPFHVQHSSALSETARNVRKVLAQARSPVDLIFDELPAACDCNTFGPDAPPDHEQAEQFVERLDQAIAELRACYPKLLERMREGVFELAGAKSREALGERAAALSFRVREQQLRTFVLRLADTKLGDDSWTEALGGALIGKPPVRWLDHDVDAWRAQAEELAGHFNRVEAAAFGKGSSVGNAVRLALTRADGEERSVIVGMDDLSDGETKVIHAMIRMAADADIGLDKVSAVLFAQAIADKQPDEETDGKQDQA
jgi:hypothetical protein